MLSAVCPRCEAALTFKDSMAGRQTWCSRCFANLIPEGAAAASHPPPNPGRSIRLPSHPLLLLLLGLIPGVALFWLPRELFIAKPLTAESLPYASAASVFADGGDSTSAAMPASAQRSGNRSSPRAPEAIPNPVASPAPPNRPADPPTTSGLPPDSPGLAGGPRDAAAEAGPGQGQGAGPWGKGGEAGEYGSGASGNRRH